MNIPDLCNALLASPDDDLCRLALADAVEEAGDPDTAGLLRLHAHLGSITPPTTYHEALRQWVELPANPIVHRGEWQWEYGAAHPHSHLFPPLRLPHYPRGLNRALASVVHRMVCKKSLPELRQRLVEHELHGLRLRPGVPLYVKYKQAAQSYGTVFYKNWRCLPLRYAPGAILCDLLYHIVTDYPRPYPGSQRDRARIAVQLSYVLDLIDVYSKNGGNTIQRRLLQKCRQDNEARWLALSEEQRNAIKEKQWRKYYP